MPSARTSAIGEPRRVIRRTLEPRLIGDDVHLTPIDLADLSGLNQLPRRLHRPPHPVGQSQHEQPMLHVGQPHERLKILSPHTRRLLGQHMTVGLERSPNHRRSLHRFERHQRHPRLVLGERPRIVLLKPLQLHPQRLPRRRLTRPTGIGHDDRVHLPDLSQRRKIRPEVCSPRIREHRHRDSSHVLPRCVEAPQCDRSELRS